MLNQACMRFTVLFLFNILVCISYGQDSTHQIREVSIRALRANMKMMTAISTLKPKDIESVNLGQDIPTLFQALPSVTSGSDAGNGIGYSYLTIRGLDAQRVQVNINGIPYNDAESHEVYWVNIPDMLSSADDIQIQRGVGYSTMGGTGLGGTISIKTTKRYKEPFLNYSSNFGSFNTMRQSVNTSTGVLKDGWQVNARGSIIHSDGFVDRAASNLNSIYFNLSKYGEKISSHLMATHGREKTYQAWYGLTEADYNAGLYRKNTAGTDYEQKSGDAYANQTDNYGQSNVQWLNNFNWNNKHNSSLSFYLSHGKGYFEEYKVGANYGNYSNTLNGNGDLIRQLWLDNISIGMNASHIIDHETLTNTSSFSLHQYQGDHYGKIVELLDRFSGEIPDYYYQNHSLKTDISGFNKLNYSIGESNMTLDVQLRSIQYEVNGSLAENPNFNIKKSFLFFNPKIGWNMRTLKGGMLYSFIGLHHREPNRSDFILEDSIYTPRPEQVIDLELGHNWVKSKWTLHSNLFVMYFQDQLIPTGALNSVGAPVRQNVPKSYRMGLELEFSYKFNSKWTLYTAQYLALNKILNYVNVIPTYNEDYTRNQIADVIQNFSSTDIANSPNWISFIDLKFNPWEHTQIEFINKLVSRQYLDNTSSANKSLPLYSFANIAVMQKLYPKNSLKEITLNLLLNNIFNSNYVPRGYTYNSGNVLNQAGKVTNGSDNNFYYPQAGFNVLLGIQFGL